MFENFTYITISQQQIKDVSDQCKDILRIWLGIAKFYVIWFSRAWKPLIGVKINIFYKKNDVLLDVLHDWLTKRLEVLMTSNFGATTLIPSKQTKIV